VDLNILTYCLLLSTNEKTVELENERENRSN
jgi:hypothetical protein